MDGLAYTVSYLFNAISNSILAYSDRFELDVSEPVILMILCIAYIFAIFLICKLIVGVIRWFYRI